MSTFGNNHLTDEQLIFYVDGELGSRENARVRKHLESCWACRAKLENLEGVIKKIVEFDDQVLQPMVPPPPRHWGGLQPRLTELDAIRKKRSVTDRLTDLLRSSLLEPRRVVFAILVLAALGGLIWLPSQPVISANELLSRVQAAQSAEFAKISAPVVHERLRVRRKFVGSNEQATTDYDSWADRSRGRFRQTGSSSEILTEFRTICDANRLDWQAPLSGAGFARWRDSLPARQDIVAAAQPSTAGYDEAESKPLALTTIARSPVANSPHGDNWGANRITQAELIVRKADWHPVEERLWVNNREYEIAELDYRVLPPSAVDGTIFAEQLAPLKPVEGPVKEGSEVVENSVPPPPDPDETEMAVRYELHRLNADLGEPIEITRDSRGEVEVEAPGVAPDLKAKLKQVLSSVPNTNLEVDETLRAICEGCPGPLSGGQVAPETSPAPTMSIVPTVNPNEKQLEDIFGDAHAQESFTREVLAASSDALSRGFALRDLAVRYTPEKEAMLTPHSRTQLKEMVSDHVTALANPTNLLQGLLRPLLEALSNRAAPGAGSPESAEVIAPLGEAGMPRMLKADTSTIHGLDNRWQDMSIEIFATVQKVDRMIKALLTSTDSPIPADQVVPVLRQGLSHQQQELNQFQESGQEAGKTRH